MSPTQNHVPGKGQTISVLPVYAGPQPSQRTEGVLEMSEKETELMEWGRTSLLMHCEGNTLPTVFKTFIFIYLAVLILTCHMWDPFFFVASCGSQFPNPGLSLDPLH